MCDSFLFKELSYSVIGAAFRVHSTLGCGLPEHCYNRALFIELSSLNISAVQQKLYDVHYAGTKVWTLHFVPLLDHAAWLVTFSLIL